MTVTLTRDEQATVEAKRIGERPSYFSADLQNKVQISLDFEAFLILQGAERNQKTVEWLSKTVNLAGDHTGRDGIVQEALDFDRLDNEEVTREIDTELEAFNEFRENYQAGKFSSAVETGILLSDLQSPAAELFFEQSRAKHLSNLHNYVEARLGNQGVTENEARQIQSWITPLLAY